MKITSILLSGLFVGAAGAIAAILFAPDKGTKTRSKITKKGQEYKDYILENYNDLADSVTHPFEGVEDQTIRLSKKAINEAEKLKEEAIQKVSK